MRMKQTPLAMVVGAAVTMVTAVSTARAEKPKVGIVVAVSVNVENTQNVTGLMGKALAKKFDIDVVAGEEADAKLEQDGKELLSDACIADNECLKTVSAALGVNQLLVLVVVQVDDKVQIDATLFDAETGTSNTRPPLHMPSSLPEWPDAFLANADKILPGAPPRTDAGNGGNGNGNTGGGNGNTGGGTGGGVGNGEGGGSVSASAGPSWPKYTIYAGAAVAGIGLLSGSYAIISSLTGGSCEKNGSVDLLGGCKPAQAANYLIAGGAAILAIGVVSHFVFRGDQKGSEQRLGLEPGPGDVGFALGGHF